MSEIPKAYDPQSVEDKWYQYWLDQKCFVADPASPKPAYSIVIPPPNVTGMLTLGHVLNNTIQDILARMARMKGHEVLWLPGTDHAGIATQTVVERTLKKSGEIKHRDELGRDKFLERVWQWKEKHGGIIIQQLKKLGASCDWTRERFTMDEAYSRCVQKVFVELYKKGLIYRGKRMVNWCPATLTALSDEEVVMKEQRGSLYYFKVEIAEAPGFFLTIATTRPETISGDTAVAVNPKDLRYAKFIGQHVIRPLPAELEREQKLIPIIGDEHVDFEFGTGVLKVTPAHDKADFEIGLRHNLPAIEVMDARGQMNDAAGTDLRGLDRFKAREVAAEKLAALVLLEKEEPYTNNVGFSERADVQIEPRLSEQWFLKYPSVDKARSCVEQENMVSIVSLSGRELAGRDRAELRESAFKLARERGWIGQEFLNDDTGWKILIRRKSLSHAFNNRDTVAIQAVAVLPELIRSAVLIGSEDHQPPNPRFRKVHHFVAALRVADEIYRVPMTVKELADGRMLYDHKTKKTALGGKPLVAHLPKEKLGIQPAPSADIKLSDLLADVNDGKMMFHPQRWAKVYDHWMGGLQDWCISRQLWWGHRIPVWTRRMNTLNFKTDIATLENQFEPLRQRGTVHTHFYVPEVQEVTSEILANVPNVSDLARLDVAVEPSEEEFIQILEKNGFTQDPDVLDTWFSSWLWPFATMGWPEQTDTLKKFYPTTDLVTGPDIIFFWVARMIMAGYEFMGEMPFKNVYFTGIIRDKQGRKMSKSLGNSPDPLDLIAKFGADALRFGVMRSAPLGQDVLYDEQQVELGRNFCNKLWNACRFRQLHPAEVQGEIDPRLLSVDDRWILLKLDAATRELDAAFAAYNFSDAAAILYRFFWGEYCDWYVEAVKPVLHADDPARRANTLAVIDFVLSHTLRLLHPFLPFITEELWNGMGYAKDMPDAQGGKTIMFAPWPKPLDDDFKSHYGLGEETLTAIADRQKLVIEIRNVRAQYKIPANKKLNIIYHAPADIAPDEKPIIASLANAETIIHKTDYEPAKGEPVLHPAFGGKIYIPLAGLVDAQAEKARLAKELQKVEAEILKVEAKLANPNFTSRVPPEVLQDHRQRLTDWQAKRQQLQSALDSLDS